MAVNTKKELALLGTISAYNDKDKIKKSGLDVIEIDSVKTYKQATLTFELKVLYRQTIDESCFLDKEIIDRQYPDRDYHDMYVCEVKRILKG